MCIISCYERRNTDFMCIWKQFCQCGGTVEEGGVSVFLAVMGFSRWLVSDFYLYFLPQSRWTLNWGCSASLGIIQMRLCSHNAFLFLTIDAACRQKLVNGCLCLSYGKSFVHITEDKGKEPSGMVRWHLLWNVPCQGERMSKTGRWHIIKRLLGESNKQLALSYARASAGGSLVFKKCHNWKQKTASC